MTEYIKEIRNTSKSTKNSNGN